MSGSIRFGCQLLLLLLLLLLLHNLHWKLLILSAAQYSNWGANVFALFIVSFVI